MATINTTVDANMDALTWAQGDLLNIQSGNIITVNTNQAKFWTTVNTSLSGGGQLYINNPGMRLLTFQAGGYVSCIATDIGKTVVDAHAISGVLVAYDNIQRIWTVRSASQFTVADAFTITAGTGAGTMTATADTGIRFLMGRNAGTAGVNQIIPLSGLGTIRVLGDWIDLGTGTGGADDFTSPFMASTRKITFAALGYTACISTDIGKAVVGGTSLTSALLVSYDNVNRIWEVAHCAQPYTNGEAITITAGTGAGTISALAEGTGFDFIPVLWVETSTPGTYEMWLNLTGEYGQGSEYQRGNVEFGGFGRGSGANRAKYFRQVANAEPYGLDYPLPAATTIVQNTQHTRPVSCQFSSTLRFGEQDNIIPAGRHVRIPNIIITDETRCDYYSTTAQLATRTQSANLACTNGPKVYLTTCLFSESYCDFTQAQLATITDVGFKIMPLFSECYALNILRMGITVDPIVRYFYNTGLTHWVSRGGLMENAGTEYRWAVGNWSYLNNAVITNVVIAGYGTTTTANTLGGVLYLSYTTGAAFTNVTILALNKTARGAIASYAHDCLHMTNLSGCTFTNVKVYGGGIYWTYCVNNVFDGITHSAGVFNEVSTWATPMRVGVDPNTGVALVNNTPYYFKVRSYHSYHNPTHYFECPAVYSSVQYSGHEGSLPNHPFFFGGYLNVSATPMWQTITNWANVNAAANGSLPIDATKAYGIYRSKVQGTIGAEVFNTATAATVTATDTNALRVLTCNQIVITHAALAYVNCVAGDIGKPVAGSVSGAYGILVAYDNTNYLWTVEVGDGTFAAGDTDTITGGTGSGTSTSVDTQRNLTMLVAGYVNCVAGDIGKVVTGVGSGHTGVLVAYDNTKKIWTVSTAQTFAAADACTIGGGTGVGTITTNTVHLLMNLGSYTAAVAADASNARVVTGSVSGATGALKAYDNFTRVWTVTQLTATAFAAGDICTIAAGTGIGTVTSVSTYTNAGCAEYINCVAGDIGLTVFGSISGHTGILVEYDNTNRIWNIASASAFQAADILMIVGGTGFAEAGTTVATVRRLVMSATAYTSCVAGDIGKPVLGGTSKHTGILLDYDNTNMIWKVGTILTFTAGEAVTIPTGTGGATIVTTATATGLKNNTTYYYTLRKYDTREKWTDSQQTIVIVPDFDPVKPSWLGLPAALAPINDCLRSTAIDTAATWIGSRILVFNAAAYVNCVAGDIGRAVVGGTSGNLGFLVNYNNTSRTWYVSSASAYTVAETVTCAGGTGSGVLATTTASTTVTAANIRCPQDTILATATGDSLDFTSYRDCLRQTISSATIATGYPYTFSCYLLSRDTANVNVDIKITDGVTPTTANCTLTQKWQRFNVILNPIGLGKRVLTLQLAGYVSCVVTDVGKTVTGSVSGHTGTLVAYDNTNRIWTLASTQAFQATDVLSIAAGTGAGTVTTTWAAIDVSICANANSAGLRSLTSQAGGYVSCVLTDIGLTVTGSVSGHTGILYDYDNTTRIWRISGATGPFVATDVLSIGGGTGAGTVTGVAVAACRIYVAMCQCEKSPSATNEVETTTAAVQAAGYQEINNITGWSADAGTGISFTLSAVPTGTLWSDVFMGTTANFTPSRTNLITTTFTQDTPVLWANLTDTLTVRNLAKEGYGGVGNYFVYLTGVTNSKFLEFDYDVGYNLPSALGLVNAANLSSNCFFSGWNLYRIRNLYPAAYFFLCNNNSGPMTASNIVALTGKIPMYNYWQNFIIKKVPGLWPVTHPIYKFRLKPTRSLTQNAGGYVSCVAGDIGLPVVGSLSGHTGTLVSYVNATRIWIVDAAWDNIFQVNDVLSITGGTGAGTVGTTATGYTAAVAADLTRTIIGATSGYRGVLIAFDNSIASGHQYPEWYVRTLQTFTANENLSTLSGTGAGIFKDAALTPEWNFLATPWANTTYGQTVVAANNKALYDEIFSELRFSATKGALLLQFNATAKTPAPYTISSGTPNFNNNGALYMQTEGDQVWWQWPHKILGVSGFTNLRVQLSGVNCGNNVLTCFSVKKEYQLSTDGTTWYTTSGGVATWAEMTPANLSAEVVSATNGFYLRIRLTQRKCVKYDTETNNGLLWGFTDLIGQVATFASGATGTIVDFEKEGRSGTLVLSGVAGAVANNDTIKVAAVTMALVNDATATFFPRNSSYLGGLMVFVERDDAAPDYPVDYVELTLKGVAAGSIYWVKNTTTDVVLASGTAPSAGGDIVIDVPYDFDGTDIPILVRVRKASTAPKYVPWEGSGSYDENGGIVYVAQVSDTISY